MVEVCDPARAGLEEIVKWCSSAGRPGVFRKVTNWNCPGTKSNLGCPAGGAKLTVQTLLASWLTPVTW